jgi:MFS transporter, putative metabolite:H+ symporter
MGALSRAAIGATWAEPLDAQRAALIMARIDRLPESRVVWRQIILLALAAIFEVYDLYQTAYIPVGLAREGIFDDTDKTVFGLSGQATFAAATFLGLFLGAIAFASVADRFGRRPIFLWALIGYSIATLAMALQGTATGIYACRLLAGIGLGIELVTIDAYMTEVVPKHIRGKAAAIIHSVSYLAIPLLAFLSYLLIPIDPLGVAGWRWLVLIGSTGAVMIWWLRLQLPESPRWLVARGNLDAAEGILGPLEARIEADFGRPLPSPQIRNVEADHRPTSVNIWRPPYRSLTVMLLVFNFFQTIGFYGFTNWLPTLLANQGHPITKSLLNSAIIAISFPFWPLLWSFTVADRFERKWQIVVASGVTAILGFLFAFQSRNELLILLGILITGSNTLMSFTYHPYQAELYPTPVRARAVGFVYSVSRLSTIFTSFMIAFCLQHFGATGVFVLISVSMLVVMLSIGIFGPLTRGRSLEDIAHEAIERSARQDPRSGRKGSKDE